MQEERVELVSTTVAELGSRRVGIGNVLRARYRDASGKERDELAIELHPAPAEGQAEDKITVGPGAIFELGGASWRVLSVSAGLFRKPRAAVERIAAEAPRSIR